ncbi:MAG: hypothetical protein KAS32_31060 [Candidatus Peribacteraceae bacterium]|nr:hypothetical protein [Candidatus Peribacteraceae bacterium]
MPHNFKLFPELTNRQMELYYFDSPHEQIVENFNAKVIKVTDGDTIRVTTNFRDFDFPIRLARIAAPELDEVGGIESQSWLEDLILNEEVNVKMTKQRVEKWGRLLAEILFLGMNVGKMSMDMGHSIKWKKEANVWS